MIPIFSVESDLSTSDVIDWILYFNECCFRINNINDLNSFLEQYPILTIPTTKKNFTSVWYRRRPDVLLPSEIMGDKKSDKDIRNYIYSEQYGLFEAVYSAIEKNRWLNNWENSSIGKYKQLLIAQNIGLKIPNSAIVNTKKQMNKVLKKQVLGRKLPITLLFMENILTDNSKQKVCILIKYINGEKLISYDFYKHISTY